MTHFGPPAPYAPPPQRTNGVATAGFVTALVGALLALIPLVGVVAWVLSPVGLGLSAAGLVRAGRSGGVGRGFSIAGLALGVVGLLVCLLYLLIFASVLDATEPRPLSPRVAP